MNRKQIYMKLLEAEHIIKTLREELNFVPNYKEDWELEGAILKLITTDSGMNQTEFMEKVSKMRKNELWNWGLIKTRRALCKLEDKNEIMIKRGEFNQKLYYPNAKESKIEHKDSMDW